LAEMMDELEKLSFDLYVRPPNDKAEEEDLFAEPKVVDALTYDTH
jgi:hypothetical protein